ncbi:hypothetical protein [Rhodobaculum claviforme]|uniref:Uncharacterized protein n=1 Tax=Rhodobaculum claviforme TaxID=1549854 RepID=A0A934TIJ1_9RHOB|nr:hypothetical protein [Rhodobaculum claviforme]MBK5926166.1 hypothetical protein [Rhodobaculum claviforme]
MDPAAPSTQAEAGAPDTLCRPEGAYRVVLPDWGGWLRILDGAAGDGDGEDGAQADVDRLLQGWLRRAVRLRPPGAAEFAPLASVAAMPADLADALLAEGARLFDAEARALDLRVTRDGDTVVLRCAAGSGVSALRLRPLSLAERNACLRPHLGLVDGVPSVDAAGYEIALVAASTVLAEGGRALGRAEVAALPVALGEALAREARALSDPDAAAEIEAFLAAGLPHPDIELAGLCLAYGLSPAEAEALPAATARRLGAAAQLVGAAGSAATPAIANRPPDDPGRGALPDTLTRIVVRDG